MCVCMFCIRNYFVEDLDNYAMYRKAYRKIYLKDYVL